MSDNSDHGPLPLGALDGLRYLIVALPEPSINYFGQFRPDSDFSCGQIRTFTTGQFGPHKRGRNWPITSFENKVRSEFLSGPN